MLPSLMLIDWIAVRLSGELIITHVKEKAKNYGHNDHNKRR